MLHRKIQTIKRSSMTCPRLYHLSRAWSEPRFSLPPNGVKLVLLCLLLTESCTPLEVNIGCSQIIFPKFVSTQFLTEIIFFMVAEFQDLGLFLPIMNLKPSLFVKKIVQYNTEVMIVIKQNSKLNKNSFCVFWRFGLRKNRFYWRFCADSLGQVWVFSKGF